MTIKEALAEIRSKPKWYFTPDEKEDDNIRTANILTAQRIEDGRAKPSTIKAFFAKFGYETIQTTIIKKP